MLGVWCFRWIVSDKFKWPNEHFQIDLANFYRVKILLLLLISNLPSRSYLSSLSFIDFEKVIKQSAISLNDRSSWLGMSLIKGPGSSLCGWYCFFERKINSLTLTFVASFFFYSSLPSQKKFLKELDLLIPSFHFPFYSLIRCFSNTVILSGAHH